MKNARRIYALDAATSRQAPRFAPVAPDNNRLGKANRRGVYRAQQDYLRAGSTQESS